METLRKKLEFEAWERCNGQSEIVHLECISFYKKLDKEWHCAVKKHQDHVFCIHNEKDKINEQLKAFESKQLKKD